MYFIREMSEKDLEKVHGLILRTVREVYNPELIRTAHMAWASGALVADSSYGIIGAMVAVKDSTGGRILILAVDERFRRRGIASALIKRFLSTCIMEGVWNISLEVSITNIKAIKLYQKFGFKITDVLEGYYSQGDDAYVMTRTVP